MRTAFIQQLIVEARRNPRIFLVVGDLGYSVVEPFAREFPDRFLNAGVAEQNMTGVAAGLASEGYHVFTYSIANFPTLRCLEQIRNDICYHNLPVTVVAVGAGLAYGNLGYSHHGVQDIAMMHSLPNLTLLSPADPGETVACVQHFAQCSAPSYLRLGKAGEKVLHDKVFTGPRPMRLRTGGNGLAFAATGPLLANALAASDCLRVEHRIQAAVFSCPWLAPISRSDLSALWEFSTIISLEEHTAAGGFGEILRALAPAATAIRPVVVSAIASSLVGHQDYLRAACGLDVASLIAAARAYSGCLALSP